MEKTEPPPWFSLTVPTCQGFHYAICLATKVEVGQLWGSVLIDQLAQDRKTGPGRVRYLALMDGVRTKGFFISGRVQIHSICISPCVDRGGWQMLWAQDSGFYAHLSLGTELPGPVWFSAQPLAASPAPALHPRAY
jgi:hypothetical protein